MAEDSLRKRYFLKLSANIIGLAINFVTQSIISRGLGPKTYGDFNFLTNFFNGAIGFLDMGTSMAFYTKLSQRQKEHRLVSFYIYFSIVVSIGLLIFVFLCIKTSKYTLLWPSQELLYIYMAAIWAIITWIVLVLNKMVDAYALTVSGEVARFIQKMIGLILILILYILHKLNLLNFFYYHYILLFLLCVIFIWILRANYSISLNWRLSLEQIKGYVREFYNYSHPLFVYSLVGFIVGVMDRWLLQVFGGSIQQGFYSLSYQIGAVCFLFTGAMSPLLMREFAIAHGKKDVSHISSLFRRYIPLFYSIVAYFSCFIAIQADKVIYILAGNEYAEALTAVTIMSFFPLNQAYGQLSGSVFYATGQTTLYRNIGITFMLIGLPVSYFLIAPSEQWGLGAGATGLALKRVLLTFVGVNVQLYYNARFLKLSFWRYLGHQILCVVSFLTIAAIASFGIDLLLKNNINIILNFILAGMAYTFMAAVIVYSLPGLVGLTRQDTNLIIQKFLIKVNRRKQ